MFWIFSSAEVTLVQCCVFQWHLFSKFPNTISVLRPSLSMHLLIPCDRLKKAGFSCTLEIKISPEVYKQRSLRICGVGTVSEWNLCISRLCDGGKERSAACTRLHGSRLKSFPGDHVTVTDDQACSERSNRHHLGASWLLLLELRLSNVLGTRLLE